MPLLYPIKHVFRNWKLFAALLIGITLASTFCAAIGVKANVASDESLNKQLDSVLTDIEVQTSLNATDLPLAYQDIKAIDGVKKVDMVTRYDLPISIPGDNYTSYQYTQMACFPNTSRIYDEWVNKPLDAIPENATYLLLGTALAEKVKVGDNITTLIEFPTPKYYNTTTIYINLTVAGFAELTDNGYAYVSGNSGGGVIYYEDSFGGNVKVTQASSSGSYSGYRSNLMIVGWENTLEKLWATTLESSTVRVTFSVDVDRQQLINPWNVEESTDKINIISEKIQNELLANYRVETYPNNMLSSVLYNYQSVFSSMVFQFIWVSIPIFFVAWYLGSTVSDVSFNIRRREIGLLSTKGLSSGQIQRMFLSEAVFIGFIGGVLGVIGGIILNQYYLGTVNLSNVFSSAMLSPEIAVITIIFGMLLSLASVFMSARRASRIPAVEALRNYSISEHKPRFRFIPWIALVLGSYKIVVFILGLNIQTLMQQLLSSGGFFLNIFYVPVIYFDMAMTFFGPFLFFWGFTKIVIRDSTKFQKAASKISSVMGDLGALAAKNVRRNPARLAAMAFLIAFIIGYSVQVTGQVASQEDYLVRQVHNDVGADITVDVVNQTKGNIILAEILANVSGIRNASVERTLSAPVSSGGSYIDIKTVDPNNWTLSAYYEPEWFTGAGVDQAMHDLANDNNTIILDRTLAETMGKNLYDTIGINFNSCPRELRIVGFFGPEPNDNNQPRIYSSQYGYQTSAYSAYYSFVPHTLFNISLPDGDAFRVEHFQTSILIHLQPGANGTQVADQIRQLDTLKYEVSSITSFDEQWRSSQNLTNLGTFSEMQVLDIQGLGLLFAVLSASVGTALIAIVSLKERSREATLMSVRGLSYRQLVFMFLTESMAIITFAVILGVVVGAIIAYGNIAASNAGLYTSSLVMQRLVYPVNAVATIGTYVALIYTATIGAILVMSSQYVTKLEKMVRTK